ncbi:phosphoacetylglucosamine mutase isoform X2 [Cephus cinctus]|uniref:Phosphoacetylglucosamine mutase n=1 Tax=Cephus cinctus TaxID=211228 RepID=A0AAJ7R6Y4_CEPCN|nr:phosphoacetylglucosamine mutase isoform X2 [Cephus cinctus]
MMVTYNMVQLALEQAVIGLMITASHNPECDNGVKLVDPAGEMLEASWEKIATELANVNDSDISSTVQRIISEQNISINTPASVIIGRDTRTSSAALANSSIAGITAANGTFKNFGVITTPQLHYLVVCTNTNGSYGDATLEGYYRKLSNAFKSIRGGSPSSDKYVPSVKLDAANGVGAIAAREFKKQLEGFLNIEIYNVANENLNHECGADYVKVQQVPPATVPVEINCRCVSIDGDADRVVYYYVDEKAKFHLLDGDRIATLVAGYFKELLNKSGLNLKLGLVQTAYANGGSTHYIENVLKIPVACVPTGVKHLHHKALEFDIGIYFEANGHGTVVFKDSAIEAIRETSASSDSSTAQKDAASKLASAIEVINQTVGDALSDMLLVETILHANGWDVLAWESSYNDLPNKQVKVKVEDRNVISTTDAERKCVKPVGLQEEIDKIVSRYPKGRSFIRASGTEDVVRVYAECENSTDVEKIAQDVASAVRRLAGGVSLS